LVDMHTQLDAARLLLQKAAAAGTSDASNSGQVAPDVPGFPGMLEAAQAKIFASETAIKVTNDALQIFGSAGYSRNLPLERMARDARMFTIGGGTAQILRTVVASVLLDRKLPQTRDGHFKLSQSEKK
ncbi:MAG: acyl-CoA dehydrogenase, partial [Proteobacteria bacterium]|nr:acyl-CoA dehydrogenase [Pseudomonadota bacterium]